MAETENKSSHVMKIPTTKEKFFLEYLMIKRPVLNAIIRKLNNGQHIRGKTPELHYMPMKVLAQLLYYNDKYRTYPEEDRFQKVFSYEIKHEIMDNLDISEDNLNAYFTQLRKIRILDGKTINPFFIVYPEGSSFEITFKFDINEQSDGETNN